MARHRHGSARHGTARHGTVAAQELSSSPVSPRARPPQTRRRGIGRSCEVCVVGRRGGRAGASRMAGRAGVDLSGDLPPQAPDAAGPARDLVHRVVHSRR
ncbi:hypothetical protein SHJG_1729 [Streptomyces hygroscopicus subsp. jinggangensis 5008]|nr:hypothetical protein SHJG_1729 [Streptomyces hygroscopicus subsp. jinggangensis 5008]AGF61160.1 hypothetical protein SHJGH_1494 [Streptomyces hygroscopicus subsp. jinggangensis TL01]